MYTKYFFSVYAYEMHLLYKYTFSQKKGDSYAVKVANPDTKDKYKDTHKVELDYLKKVQDHEHIVRLIAIEHEVSVFFSSHSWFQCQCTLYAWPISNQKPIYHRVPHLCIYMHYI